MQEPIRWGILGAAHFARTQMGPAIHAAKGARLAGLATSSPDKARDFAAFAPGLQVYDGYEALLVDPQIDAVYIPLPNHMHVEWSLRAIEAGKHVLCEKPMAMRAAEYQQLIDARDRSGLQVAEAYMIVHHPQWQRTRALVAEGAIGTLRHVNGLFTYDNSSDPGNIRNKPDTGGGGIPDIGVYTMGSTRWVTGQEPQELEAQVTWENGVDVKAEISARFDGFSHFSMVSMRLHPYQEMVFHGTEGLIRLTAPFNPNVYGAARVEWHRSGGDVVVETFPSANHYVTQVEAFGRAIHGAEPFAWPLEQARGTQEMIDRVFAAGFPR